MTRPTNKLKEIIERKKNIIAITEINIYTIIIFVNYIIINLTLSPGIQLS